jgi:hypothetical protein
MASVPGTYFRSKYGADEMTGGLVQGNSITNFTMAALNNCAAYRFTAPDTRDISSVWIFWTSVSSPGKTQLRVETIDTTSGKPTGTLYDANASIEFTPTANWQQCTFAVQPTTGLTAGNEFAILIITTTAGTTQTLGVKPSSLTEWVSLPIISLTAANGSTRSNLVEFDRSLPICSIVFSDNNEELLGFCPYATFDTSNNIFGTAGVGLTFSIFNDSALNVAGIEAYIKKIGTPAGDLRAGIYQGSARLTSITLPRNSASSLTSNAKIRLYFNSPITLVSGTYRLVFDSASSANSSNCWQCNAAVARSSNTVPSGFAYTTTTDVTASPITWTDTANKLPGVNLIVDNLIDQPAQITRPLLSISLPNDET